MIYLNGFFLIEARGFLKSDKFKVPVTVHIEDNDSYLHVKEGFKLSEKGIDTIKPYL